VTFDCGDSGDCPCDPARPPERIGLRAGSPVRYARTPWHALMRRRYGYPVICSHLSHRLRLPCLRRETYDGYCGRHNMTCFDDDASLTAAGRSTE
jgi:hypothetical protein